MDGWNSTVLICILVRKRTKNLIKRLQRDSKMLELNGDIIADQERRRFIERVPESEIQNTTKRIHNIPHHAVQKGSATTPIRIVYDCSRRESSNNAS